MIELNKVHNLDCVDGLKQLDDNSVDLIVTSPPYNVGIDYDTWKDEMPWQDYLEWCKKWLTECFRVLKDDGRICINHYIAFSSPFEDVCQFPLMDFRNIMTDIGFNVHKLAIWDDRTMNKYTAWGSWMSASAPNIMTPYEGILIAYKKQWNKLGKGESTMTKEQFIEGVSGLWHLGTTRSLTKANFPESLPSMCINLLTYKGDLVVDPFMGSGTTGVSAVKNDREFIGFELSPNYCKLANDRIEASKIEKRSELWN